MIEKRQWSNKKLSTGYADVNGTRLYYELAGAGHSIVLIHGFTLDTRMWDDQFEAFAQYYRVLRYDARGFGRSEVPAAKSYSHSDDLMALLEHVGVSDAYILGLSLGGSLATNFTLAYPEASRALIPVAPGLRGFKVSPEVAGWLQSLSTSARAIGVEAAKETWLGLPWFTPAQQKPGVYSRIRQIVSDYSGWHWLNENPVLLSDPPEMELLDRITVPTLLIVGDQDVSDNHVVVDLMQQAIPNARKVVIPGVGHMSNMEDPQRFNEIVLDFLADIDSTAK
ncbi:MAG: alpha/beta fold hydrolase [Anaerolineales bacterium]